MNGAAAMSGEDMSTRQDEGMLDKAKSWSPIVTAAASALIAGTVLLGFEKGMEVIESMREDISATKTAVGVLQTDMSWVKQSVGNIYTEDDADRDLRPIRQQLSDHSSRLDSMSIRVREIEKRQERR